MAKPLTKQDVAELILDSQKSLKQDMATMIQHALEKQNEQLGIILKQSFDHIDDEFHVVKTDIAEIKHDMKHVAWRYELVSLQRRFDTIEQEVKLLRTK